MSVISVLIAEDVELLADAFEALLSTDEGLTVVGHALRGDAVVPAVRASAPAIVLMDVDMPGLSGIEATAALRRGGISTPVLLLTALPGSGYVHAALAVGANGYLLKSTTAVKLIDGIKAVANGHTVIDPDLAADALLAGPNPLRQREMEVLALAARGMSTRKMAQQLFLSPGTVRNYMSSAMTKLEAETRVQAITTARNRGWI